MPNVRSQKKKGRSFHICFHYLCNVFLYIFPMGGITRLLCVISSAMSAMTYHLRNTLSKTAPVESF